MEQGQELEGFPDKTPGTNSICHPQQKGAYVLQQHYSSHATVFKKRWAGIELQLGLLSSYACVSLSDLRRIKKARTLVTLGSSHTVIQQDSFLPSA